MIDFSRNHFELLGLPLRYRIDDGALELAYRRLQGIVHPDRYAAAGDAEKRLALQASARANEACRTLRDPVARAEYLLLLRGIDATSQTDTHLPAAFLAHQLERREAAEEASAAHDVRALSRLVDEARGEAADLTVAVERLLDADADDCESARTCVRELRFLVKLADDLEALCEPELDR
ncbi:MAG TPA: Fe-S protein assembly co-chaperone HscB [Casimicrobiaceae bacterium]